MWPFTHSLDELAEVDLRALVTAAAREGTGLEFKREMYQRRDPERTREMLRDVASMANADGGVLIIGMEEDGQGTAQQLIPVPDAEAEANRLVQLCLAHIAERIPGLRALRTPIQGGDVIVVRIPRSYRRPHMITFEGMTDFWIRHDRQKSRMSVAEVRTAVTGTEDVEMKVQRYAESRMTSGQSRGAAFIVAASPMLIEDGRISIEDERLRALLRRPPTFRPRVGVSLSDEDCKIHPTLRGLAAVVAGIQELEVFRNGHVEFLLFRHDMISKRQAGTSGNILHGWAVAEYIRNFAHLIVALRGIGGIVDPYLIAVAIFNCRGVSMAEAGVDMWGRGRIGQWTEDDHIVLDPILMPADEPADSGAQRVANRLWNAFHFQRCPFFLDDGRFHIPGR